MIRFLGFFFLNYPCTLPVSCWWSEPGEGVQEFRINWGCGKGVHFSRQPLFIPDFPCERQLLLNCFHSPMNTHNARARHQVCAIVRFLRGVYVTTHRPLCFPSFPAHTDRLKCKSKVVHMCVWGTATKKSAAPLKKPTGCPHQTDHWFLSSVITVPWTILVQPDYGLDSKLLVIVSVSMERVEVACREW